MNQKYCKCGCGKEIVDKFHHKYYGVPVYINGHNHPKHTEEFKKSLSERQMGKKNVIYRQDIKEKMIQSNIKNASRYWLGKERDENTKNKISKTKKGIPNPSHSLIMKEFWKTEEYRKNVVENVLKSLLKRPTSFEQKLILLCSKHKLPFVYTGDGRILIGYKNPDFIDENKKVIIEVFLNYFKIRDFGSVENYMKKRGEYFAKYGYKTIFIREEEIMNKNWENICLNKIGVIPNV